MSLLEQYEQQYAALIAEITAQISRLQLQNGGLERRELSSKIDASLAEAHELLEQMGLEVRDLNATQRISFTSKLNCAQVELKRLQSDFSIAKESRGQLSNVTAGHQVTLDFGGGDADAYYEDVSINNDQRQRLLDNSERIERTGNRLTDGYRVAVETESLGAQVLSDLHHQRETMQSAHSRLRETNVELGRASRTLNSMMLYALREKAVLYGVGVCFVLVVGVSLYLTFSSPTSEA